MLDQQLQAAISISLFDLSVSLALSTTLAMIGIIVYRYTHRRLNYEKSFLSTLLLISPIVAVVIMLIGSNLAMSLGMVGALSIIRFRTAVKDPRDMIYIFWMITIGLGCGTYNLKVTILFTVFISALLLILDFFQFGKSKKSSYVIVMNGIGDQLPNNTKSLIEQHASITELRSFDIVDNSWEAVFEVNIKNETADFTSSNLLHQLKDSEGVQKVSLLSPQLALPM